MALNVPNYPYAYSTTPAANAYAWVTNLSIDFLNESGRLNVGVNIDADSANAGLPAIDNFTVSLGQVLTQSVNFPGLTELVAQATTYATANPGTDPFTAIRAVLYEALLSHPKLIGATVI